ncbi:MULTISPECIES: pyridoxal 5'-phosphate synthase glutaminase subunit PdxT [unclassified Saccharopolyspora]|uniref:pyridoxal 5'-phosphate synthase glutaminase subunit PdxT n=1 Tax=unclassified Saccharopolyspora TaxID=2646250 RepID=UPI001CD21B97|nr:MULTISPECIES: pyridoxal 5'-phosphate synthase glutaminase subunit PdxT [unclassified Saccharopolyspora]MCA1189229.1 pyridoxal 5'-phosphate synthase glutaminase subunit PdxT [Saccharopolyspora sp. 6T]MCA1192734.1 pyridoxal 5'-phosphate synthase glutaminase subunit PdxT [Saccharopolyspora sp. 6V]MCA1225351.1 pyridoxal 5'-phosphate synthase glutaminase subunit PdxT [Saccharopolyspora sp. 6M]MCA1279500.1 pyridoxal 5'-phosphate synthase glutaminase subunit PdxT [Saccharopolyspora sp. 7B]
MDGAAAPVIGVLALQGGVAEHLGALDRSGAVAKPVRRPEELADLHGIVLPGGESTTTSRLLHSFELFEPLRQRIADGLPAYGSCAGMVLLAGEVLGGAEAGITPLGALDMTVRRNAFGRQVDSFEADLDFAGVDGPVHAVFIRAPWVERIGPQVRVLAEVTPRASGDPAAAGRIVAVQQGRVLATSFHPELVHGDERVHRHFVQTVRAG